MSSTELPAASLWAHDNQHMWVCARSMKHMQATHCLCRSMWLCGRTMSSALLPSLPIACDQVSLLSQLIAMRQHKGACTCNAH